MNNTTGCQKLLAQVVHDASRAGDASFFNGQWFEDICAMLNWDPEWVREQNNLGNVPVRRRSLADYRGV